ncbi:hypothetical protein ACV33P_15540 [Pseudomonas aeruginosa]|uniref:hypothetical protein n=1 Tax=Pseudomonas aeruginosa TaxID=287 RepID=UPI00053F0125|nr:hypothetical protein [Pseudomonas aeruginosa]AYN83412.1 hypothetical protein D9D06_13205 [Pseudomonas aeruginosa]MCC0321281.1 hypothetical protein [Pseudomonas aeruginosa]MCS9316306.1 hypothetical protein [Pseudomonas aeruginosa]MCT0556752.1 hypothetical protein [Pseudomonas aeruginosa]
MSRASIQLNDQISYTQIDALVDGRSVMSISNHIYGTWTVGSSSCLPSDINKGRAYVKAMSMAFDKLDEITKATGQ